MYVRVEFLLNSPAFLTPEYIEYQLQMSFKGGSRLSLRFKHETLTLLSIYLSVFIEMVPIHILEKQLLSILSHTSKISRKQ